jgi:hypothetical protein
MCDSFKFDKSRQPLVGAEDESLSVVALSVCREKRATIRINEQPAVQPDALSLLAMISQYTRPIILPLLLDKQQ